MTKWWEPEPGEETSQEKLHRLLREESQARSLAEADERETARRYHLYRLTHPGYFERARRHVARFFGSKAEYPPAEPLYKYTERFQGTHPNLTILIGGIYVIAVAVALGYGLIVIIDAAQ